MERRTDRDGKHGLVGHKLIDEIEREKKIESIKKDELLDNLT